MYANESNFERVVTYTERLIGAGLNEFAALLVTDALRKTPAIANTHAFIRAQGGPIGTLIHG